MGKHKIDKTLSVEANKIKALYAIANELAELNQNRRGLR